MIDECLGEERQITFAPHGHLLTHRAVWSPCSEWLVVDVRSDAAGAQFDGTRIERVHVPTGKVETVYEAARGAPCGVATYHPLRNEVVFITGPEDPTPDWSYSMCHRQGVIVNLDAGQGGGVLDARDLTPPFTPGALRGGSHVHLFSPDGTWLSFTYEDDVLDRLGSQGTHDHNLRTVAVAVPVAVRVPKTHPRNHDGSHFCVVVTKVVNQPTPGSDEIVKACEECWIGERGYRRADSRWQDRALAFLGDVVFENGTRGAEVFVVDLPHDLTQPGAGPLQGTETCRPAPPAGCMQRRVTFTAARRFPGVQGPRHWLQTSPDGSRIAFLMRDDHGVCQIFTVATIGGAATPLSHVPNGVSSAINWSRCGKWLAHLSDGSVCVTSANTGKTLRLTAKPSDTRFAPRPEACVISPSGKQIAYVRPVTSPLGTFNQLFTAQLPESATE
jgi:hypothetical protein